MSDEQIWQLRGLYSQVAELQFDVVTMLTDRKVNVSRVRDFKRSLEGLAERIDSVAEAA